MSSGLYTHTTRSTGTILTAAIYNSDHQNHITNHNPSQMGGYSDSVAQMQNQTDPGGLGSESLAASLAGELQRMRFVLARLAGVTNWYEEPIIFGIGGVTDSLEVEDGDLRLVGDEEDVDENHFYGVMDGEKGFHLVQPFEPGTRMLFQQSSTPDGWTKEGRSEFNNIAMRIVTGGVSGGGNHAFSTVFDTTSTNNHTLNVSRMPSHPHDGTISINQQVITGGPGSVPQFESVNSVQDRELNIEPAGGGNSHSHGIDLRVRYRDFIIGIKDD